MQFTGMDSERYERVIQILSKTSLMIAEMSNVSTGQGMEIQQAGINHKAERVVYNATKWGVTGFCKSLQDEVAKYGIRVTNVMSGMMKTDMFKKLNIAINMANGVDTKEVARLVNFIIETPADVMIPEVGIIIII